MILPVGKSLLHAVRPRDCQIPVSKAGQYLGRCSLSGEEYNETGTSYRFLARLIAYQANRWSSRGRFFRVLKNHNRSEYVLGFSPCLKLGRRCEE